ncbi:Predicted arabinose efflux permease, MFS family [Agrococcus baldri]|uniref:Predicted arabinose efflux permease, MFS family n=1 Tax=Agrococcus baldri TaxID=153730 RepID=A0AA94HNZ1_9MICO|nr:MFS transporter [Agrococcus baldri]SFS15739.1 Predicted arabinose efflux permease, MFS family [Agrococcus baldri]
MSGVDRSERFPWRKVAGAAYVPTAAFAIGEGAVIPYIPLIAGDLGASLAVAAVVAAMLTVGQLAGDVPGGSVVARFGERATMVGAGLLVLVSLVIAFFSTEWWMLAVAIFVLGLGHAVFALARHAFMTTYVPLRYRARALSTLGGIFRMGMFVGPLIGSAVLGLGFALGSVWVICAIGTIVAIVVLIVLPDPSSVFEHSTATTGVIELRAERTGIWQVVRQNARSLATVGIGAAMLALARQARNVLLPLWAISIGLDGVTTGLVIGIAGGVDFALFFVSGWVMDRFGRLWSVVPSLALMALSFLLLALTHDIDAAVLWFWIAALVMALGNGLGSGILMTLGADLADPRNPAPFLGAWRLTTDAGGAVAPLLISLLISVASITWAAGGLTVLCLFGAGMLLRWLPRKPRGA